MAKTIINGVVPIEHILTKSDKNLLNFNQLTHTTTPAINVQPDITEVEFIRDFRQPCASQHRQYTGKISTLFNHISSAAETRAVPAIDTMTATLQYLHMSELSHHDEDAVDPDGPNDIDVSRMLTGGCNNNDFTIVGSSEMQLRIRDILHEFSDIFRYNVKSKAMAVPQ